MDKRLLNMIELTDFEKLFKQRGYAYFTSGDYNVNIIGIRNLMDGVVQTNEFNDALLFTYKANGVWKKHVYEFTTDPGLTSLKNPSSSTGACAILCPHQYRGTYCLGTHNAGSANAHRTLVQRLKPVAVYRDGNKDNVLNFDPTTVDVGYFGINIHRAKKDAITQLINGYSAGCQVFKDSKKHEEFIAVCEKSAKLYGNSFTYTLITSDMLATCVYC